MFRTNHNVVDTRLPVRSTVLKIHRLRGEFTGAEILAQWDLFGTLAATRAPPICRHMTFDVGPFALRGAIPDANEGMGGFCPRRTVLDTLLLRAAAEAGVEVREGFTVDDLLITGDTVVGIRGHERDGRPVEETSRMVIGADGVNSFVARAVRAPEYDVRPVAAMAAERDVEFHRQTTL